MFINKLLYYVIYIYIIQMLCNAGIVKQSVGILDRMEQVRCSFYIHIYTIRVFLS